MKKGQWLGNSKWAVAALGVAVGWASPAFAASTPRAISLIATCGLRGVNGDPNDTNTPQDHGDHDADPVISTCPRGVEGWFDGRLEWYSNGVLVYTEMGPFFGVESNDHSVEIQMYPDGNNSDAQFAAAYENPQTSIFTEPGLSFKLYYYEDAGDDDHGAKKKPKETLLTNQLFKPYGAALWSKHSEDTIQLGLDVAAGDAATLAAAKVYTDQQVAAEAAQRKAGDAAQMNYTDTQIAAVRAEAAADEMQDTIEMQNEANARMAGDQQAVATSEAYTDSQVAAEAAARKQGDAQTLAAANAYTDAQVANEAAARQAGDAAQMHYTDTQVAAVRAEAAADEAQDTQEMQDEANARMAGDQQAVATSEAYTDSQVAAEAAARKQGDAQTLASANAYTDAQVANEAAARQAGDAAQMQYTNQQVALVRAEAAADEAQDTQEMQDEANARMAGDQQAIATSEAYTDSQVAAEAAARKQGDADTLRLANSYTDSQVAMEAAARKQGDTQTLTQANAYTDQQIAAVRAEAAIDEAQDTQELMAEASARMLGDQQAIATSMAYTDQQVAAEAAARKQGDIQTLAMANAYTDTQVAALQSQILTGNNTYSGNNIYNGTSTFNGAVIANGGITTTTAIVQKICFSKHPSDCRDSFNDEGSPTAIFPAPQGTPNTAPSCPPGQTLISAGPYNFQCGLSCAFGTGDCNNNVNDGCETNIGTSTTNCGGCGQACSTNNITPVCAGAQCSGACNAGFSDCNNNLRTDGCETHTATDPANCGMCGVACSSNHIQTATCTSGTCSGACDAGFLDCNMNKQTDGCEVSGQIDPNNCGACGSVCSSNNISNRSCGAGVCNGACNTGYSDCDNNKLTNGCEINTQTDVNNCGGCAMTCSSANVVPACGAGSCQAGTCLPGYADCNNNKRADGCEINTSSDISNCGACGNVCAPVANAATVCAAGVCGLGPCAPGFFNVDGNNANGCECAAPGTNSCNSAQSVGNVPPGGTIPLAGTIPGNQGERWYLVTFSAAGIVYHPHVTLSGANVVLDIFTSCGNTPISCGIEGGASVSRTDWETNQTAGDPAGGGTQGGSFTYTTPTPNQAVYVRVRATSNTCTPYTINFHNN